VRKAGVRIFRTAVLLARFCENHIQDHLSQKVSYFVSVLFEGNTTNPPISGQAPKFLMTLNSSLF
jgi:hypothetical protein